MRNETHDLNEEGAQQHCVVGDDLYAAISQGMGEVIDKVDAARRAAVSLKAHERQTLDHIVRSKQEDPFKPTPEQIALINGSLLERKIYDNPNSRIHSAIGYEIASPIQRLFDDGKIGQDELDACSIFQKDFVIGTSVAGLTSKYGERMGAGGTPLRQQADTDRLSPEERRSFHLARHGRACEFLGHRHTAFWLTAIVCEIPVGEPPKVPTFEDVGRHYGECGNRPQAKAAGEILIRPAIERLPNFYGIR